MMMMIMMMMMLLAVESNAFDFPAESSGATLSVSLHDGKRRTDGREECAQGQAPVFVLGGIQYNTISFIGKTKKVRVPADTAATEIITQYIGIWKIRKTQLKKLQKQN